MFDENNKLSLKLNNTFSCGLSDVAIGGPVGGGGVGSEPIVTGPMNPHTGLTEVGETTCLNGVEDVVNREWVLIRA